MTSVNEIEGVGPALGKLLTEAGFKNAEAIAKSSLEQLRAIPGIGAARAAAILSAAKALVNSASAGKAALARTPSQRRNPVARSSRPSRGKSPRSAPVVLVQRAVPARSETEIAQADAAAVAEMTEDEAKDKKKAKAAAKEAKAKQKKKDFEEKIKKAKEKVKKKSDKKKKKKKAKKKAKK
ncbi:helix-hairpin-helix domain-containing protein [Ruegeria sp. PrR005]|uniref:Helix-hairpin-helix domain-containing protein n=1 Tax=Ruegeria sp. PrR005 TaxID=2706882 RepID=A0A6B2P0K8_9RHOB|nr:helix-hairpin-helix domain-containing protein [Ruegeria sp. PrR005]